VKFLVIGLVALFVGYWLVQDPSSLADITSEAISWTWDMLVEVFGGVMDFTKQLLN
jgi:xanthosine utilization system XapX-like protein